MLLLVAWGGFYRLTTKVPYNCAMKPPYELILAAIKGQFHYKKGGCLRPWRIVFFVYLDRRLSCHENLVIAL